MIHTVFWPPCIGSQRTKNPALLGNSKAGPIRSRRVRIAP
jgi:hypothetical protein